MVDDCEVFDGELFSKKLNDYCRYWTFKKEFERIKKRIANFSMAHFNSDKFLIEGVSGDITNLSFGEKKIKVNWYQHLQAFEEKAIDIIYTSLPWYKKFLFYEKPSNLFTDENLIEYKFYITYEKDKVSDSTKIPGFLSRYAIMLGNEFSRHSIFKKGNSYCVVFKGSHYQPTVHVEVNKIVEWFCNLRKGELVKWFNELTEQVFY